MIAWLLIQLYSSASILSQYTISGVDKKYPPSCSNKVNISTFYFEKGASNKPAPSNVVEGGGFGGDDVGCIFGFV